MADAYVNPPDISSFLVLSEFNRRDIESASSNSLLGLKKRACPPVASGRDAALEDITGVLQRIASSTGSPNPSSVEG